MGAFRLFSRCEVPSPTIVTPHNSFKKSSKLPNPNPNNFLIEKIRTIGKLTIVMVRYPDCTNYEGKKILVYKDIDKKDIFTLKHLDPHFCEGRKHPSPIARFRPTDQGWKYAVLFCKGTTK